MTVYEDMVEKANAGCDDERPYAHLRIIIDLAPLEIFRGDEIDIHGSSGSSTKIVGT